MSRDPSVDLWATDEVHFQQYGSSCRMWIPPEIKGPVLLHHPTRRSVGYFGAVRLRDGRFFYRRETDRFNAVSFWAFLKDLRRLSRRGGWRVIVIADNAKYRHARLHKQWRHEHQDHFALGYLPPCSATIRIPYRVASRENVTELIDVVGEAARSAASGRGDSPPAVVFWF